MLPIGGYFSLELPRNNEFHKDAIRLNTGRNCLEYILRVRQYNKVFIPYYTCEVILEPFKKLGIKYEFYHVNTHLEVLSDIVLYNGDALLYTNYYGLKQSYIGALAKKYGHSLIIDNTQAFYAKPLEGIDTFYTCRKFFGVPDGAYLYCNKKLDNEYEQDVSYDRMTFLTKRIDVSAEAAYADFRAESKRLVNNPIRKMSALTRRMMEAIDYDSLAEQRRGNFVRLHQSLKSTNKMNISIEETCVPMVYPYYIDGGSDLRNRLIEKKIFIARYWQNVIEWTNENMLEYHFALSLLPLPIDQRYGKDEMDYIISNILSR